DFVPVGERYQLGRDTLVKNNELQEIYQYIGNCKVKIWENAGLGPQNDATNCTGPGGHPCNDPCTEDDACCGRERKIDIVGEGSCGGGGINCFINLREQKGPNTCGCPAGRHCSSCWCNAYKFVFPGGPGGCSPGDCCSCPECHRDNCVGYHASCIQVTK
ncbi:hypothetical protein J7J39_01105, partial [bacterium]|nr:hypothetical protein [bacterium]